MDSTLPPPNLSVLELGPLCRVCPFGTYLCPIIKNTPLQAFQTIKNLTLKQDQSKSEVVKQYWTKRELENKIDIEENLHILDATKDVRVQGRFLRKIITKKLEKRSGFEDNEEDPGKDLSDKVDSFFKSPAEEKSSNLFLKKLQKSKDETDNEEGKVWYSHKMNCSVIAIHNR
ncbi:hypothetical protein RhiirB3_100197 [Rhizophagus irregularis]|nr:hypothetical protein RhiirB3_100197 [Rhizophagus irregularis]